MQETGIRDLRDHLSAWIDKVRQGETVLVTDRGTPVAQLGPPDGLTQLERLVASGDAIPASAPRSLPDRLQADQPVSPLVAEHRR